VDTLLDIKDLQVFYKTELGPLRAVDGVNLNVKRKEILGLAGESACGKTTLVQAVLKLIKPPGYIVGGEVLFNGINLLKASENKLRQIRWKEISYIPQSSMNALNPVMKIANQIIDVIEAHEGKVRKREALHYIEELLVKVGLSREVAKMYPHELSGGMRQRVVIAMALALNPKLIIADEPTTALDVVTQRGIIQMLKDINKDFGTTLLLVTHDMAIHAEITDRIAIMYAGKILEIGLTNKVFSEPLHPYTRLLISSIPRLGSKQRLVGISGFPPDLRDPPPGCRFHPRCPFVMDICRKIEPSLLKFDLERFVACHLYSR